MWEGQCCGGACEELVERALQERGTDVDIQALADLATMLPVALGAVVVIKTGGFGADLGVAGGSMATTFLLDKYKHVLGSSVTREARRRWEDQRGGVLGGAVYAAALPSSGTPLERAASTDVDLARTLRAGASAVRVAAREGAEAGRSEAGRAARGRVAADRTDADRADPDSGATLS